MPCIAIAIPVLHHGLLVHHGGWRRHGFVVVDGVGCADVDLAVV